MADTAIFDVDGTLVDSNYQHALAWFRAFRRYEITVPIWRLHRAVGMGGDLLVEHVTGPEVEREFGDRLRDASEEEFTPMLGEIRALDGAREILQAVRDRGFTVVLASSGTADQIGTLLDLFGGERMVDGWTTSEDASTSKPAPDLIGAALAKVGGRHGVMVGDATWDCIAAGRAGVPVLALRTGGFGADELVEAGAAEVFDTLDDLRARLDDTPLSAAS